MKRNSSIFVVLLAAGNFGIDRAWSADELTLESAPPVVVKCEPQSGVTNVSPGLKEIKVQFSKDMADKTWSWSTASKESFPTTDGKPHYEKDKCTCVLPVKLEPGKVYAIWLNSEKFTNFKDADGHPAVPYLLVFRTANDGGNAKAAREPIDRSAKDVEPGSLLTPSFDGKEERKLIPATFTYPLTGLAN